VTVGSETGVVVGRLVGIVGACGIGIVVGTTDRGIGSGLPIGTYN
jgi:hypothetical protein